MTNRRLFGACLIVLSLAGCTGGETENVQVERLPHACDLLEQVDADSLVGFSTARVQRTQEQNDQFDVRISQCNHYGEDMTQRFSLVVRQDFSNRKLKSGEEQLAELRQKLGEFSQDGVDWRDIDNLGEAAAWNGTANQLTIYEDKGHTTLAVSVYGTGKEQEQALELARATLEQTHYAPGGAQ